GPRISVGPECRAGVDDGRCPRMRDLEFEGGSIEEVLVLAALPLAPPVASEHRPALLRPVVVDLNRERMRGVKLGMTVLVAVKRHVVPVLFVLHAVESHEADGNCFLVLEEGGGGLTRVVDGVVKLLPPRGLEVIDGLATIEFAFDSAELGIFRKPLSIE